jgi:hypothetical protein
LQAIFVASNFCCKQFLLQANFVASNFCCKQILAIFEFYLLFFGRCFSILGVKFSRFV